MGETIPFDKGRHPRAKLGFILIATDQTGEKDMMTLAPDGVGVHFTRIPMGDSITVETLGGLGDHISEAAATLLPDDSLDVCCYACTSGSMVLGEERVFQDIRKGAPDAAPTSLVTAVMHALETLSVKKIAVATPYVDGINTMLNDYVSERGYDIVNMTGMGLEKDSEMVRVPPSYIADFAVQADRPEAEALFVSCSALRSLDCVQEIEDRIGKPVIVSTQAMMWHCLRLAGIDDKIEGYGALLRDY